MIDRRTFLVQGAALAAGGCACPFGGVCASSVYGGIPIGVITYSYRTMPVGKYKTLEYVKGAGLSEIELMFNDLEVDAGSPVRKLPGKMSKDEKAMVAAWRKTVDVRRFEEVRDKYEAAGVKAHIVKFGYIDGTLPDEDLEYCFKVAKAMGASTITREIPDPKKIWLFRGLRKKSLTI